MAILENEEKSNKAAGFNKFILKVMINRPKYQRRLFRQSTVLNNAILTQKYAGGKPQFVHYF